jgi:hypothetical protein
MAMGYANVFNLGGFKNWADARRSRSTDRAADVIRQQRGCSVIAPSAKPGDPI